MSEILITSFFMGLMGGVHCTFMCGAVVGILSNSLPIEIQKNPQKLIYFQLTYNIGRISTYIVMGIIFATFSSVLASQIGMTGIEQFFRILAAIMMIFAGLFIAGFSNKIQIIEKIGQKLWSKLEPFSKKYLPITNYKNAFLFGFFWGNLPCGLVYTALILTLSVSPIDGGLIMLFFGLGTLPALLSIAGFGFGFARFMQQKQVQKTAGIIIIIMGITSLIMPIMHQISKHH